MAVGSEDADGRLMIKVLESDVDRAMERRDEISSIISLMCSIASEAAWTSSLSEVSVPPLFEEPGITPGLVPPLLSLG